MSATVRLASTLGQLQRPARSTAWPELDRVLPDGGLPHAVVELTCAHEAWAGATSVAVAAVRAVHARDARLWCAWVDSESTLYAPGLARAGVDLRRLFVARPGPKLLQRVMVKVASSGAFDVVIVDVPRSTMRDRLVRKLAIAAEQHGTTIVLLAPPHADPWPVALRLEVSRTKHGIDVRVVKDRFGRATAAWSGASGAEGGLKKTHVTIPPIAETA